MDLAVHHPAHNTPNTSAGNAAVEIAATASGVEVVDHSIGFDPEPAVQTDLAAMVVAVEELDHHSIAAVAELAGLHSTAAAGPDNHHRPSVRRTVLG